MRFPTGRSYTPRHGRLVIEPWKGLAHSANIDVQPEGTTRAVLAFVHGFSDHCELPLNLWG